MGGDLTNKRITCLETWREVHTQEHEDQMKMSERLEREAVVREKERDKKLQRIEKLLYSILISLIVALLACVGTLIATNGK